MDAVNIVNLALSFVAILVSVFSIFISFKWSQESSRNLEQAKDILKDVEKTADQINQNVSDKMDDLIRRAAPSIQEQVESQAMAKFFEQVFQQPEIGLAEQQ
ncbi:MAG: hypothetical protein PHI32_08105 [Dysgonamonadaceae bacterium]|jgi:hypothetical protein|nr:hypothetical protein [Dysgonamonadaceae bacterium]MDD4729034.1 hypothetical protein [Dysgonamonadaceae bacterium]